MSSTDLGLSLFELVVMLFSLCLHDCVQAWAANRLGDPTARMNGRLTMNPLQHYDVWGTIVFPLIYLVRSPPLIMGWTKPIPVTSRNFRKPRRDENLVYASGPAAQLLLAVVALIVLLVMRHSNASAPSALQAAALLAMHVPGISTVDLPSTFPLMLLLYYCVFLNTLLFVFNLVPFPYFDGGKILVNYLPYNAAQTYQRMGIYFMLGFFLFGFGIVMLFFRPMMAVFNGLLGI